MRQLVGEQPAGAARDDAQRRAVDVAERAVHALDRAGLRVAAAGLDRVDACCAACRGSCPPASAAGRCARAARSASARRPGRIAPPRKLPSRAEHVDGGGGAGVHHQAGAGVQRRAPRSAPPSGRGRAARGARSGSCTPQRSASPRSHSGSASKMLVQLTSSWCAPSPATLEMTMRSGSSCVTENGLTWSLEAANSISDTRGDALPVARCRPCRVVQPSPLHARIAGVDGEDHAALADTTRPLRIARIPARVRSAARRPRRGRRRCRSPSGRRPAAPAGAARRGHASPPTRRCAASKPSASNASSAAAARATISRMTLVRRRRAMN